MKPKCPYLVAIIDASNHSILKIKFRDSLDRLTDSHFVYLDIQKYIHEHPDDPFCRNMTLDDYIHTYRIYNLKR